MVTVKISNVEYNIKDEWDEITLEEFVHLQQICDKAPKKLKDIMHLVLEGKTDEISSVELSDREKVKTFPKFYGDLLVELSDIPKKVVNTIDSVSRETFFYTYLSKVAISCMHHPVDIPEVPRDSFDFVSSDKNLSLEMKELINGKYILPKSKEVLGEDRPLGYISTMQFTESSDLDLYMRGLDKKDYTMISNIVSILCVKEGEEYDEDISLARAKHFKHLTMDIVWDVFFYLSEVLDQYENASRQSFEAQLKENMQQLVKQQA